MAYLRLEFLGSFQASLDDRPVRVFESGRVRALLAYLAMQPERVHNRSVLAGLFWPEQSEDGARANLRQALANLRRALGDRDSDKPFLFVSREAIGIDPAANFWLDAAEFTALVEECNLHAHRRPELCSPCAQRLARAVELYRGPFLDGLFIHDSVTLEEWILLQREALQRQALRALHQLAAYHERRGAYELAHDLAWRQIQIEPWSEEAHRQAMRVLLFRGERSAALVQYETCRRLLQEGLGVEPSEETTALYDQVLSAPDDELLSPGQLVLLSPNRHNLPPQPTPFIGRERELMEIARLIETRECRLVSLVGQGGSGKTRIALQAAWEQAEAFVDGARFVSLAAVPSSDYLASNIGAAVGLSFSGQKDERAQLLDALRDRDMLLVLDNFEHLLDGVDLISEILQQAPGVTILATTREQLNLQAEWVMPIEGLPFPAKEAEKAQGAQEVHEPPENFPAVQLFVQAARRASSGFALTPEESQAVTGICRIVAGLPLAIELAAAWTRVLSCEEIGREISRSIDFLASNLKDIPERHRSLRAVFDQSWNMLSPEERDLLARLSVFRGGFRREAAQQGADATLPLLSSLMAKSFLHRNAMGRYEIHELLRQYAESKLSEDMRVRDEARDRHCRYYASLAHRCEEKLRTSEQLTAMEEMTTEMDNVWGAWRWGVEQGRWEEVDRLVESLWLFHEIRGMWQQANEAYARATDALKADFDEGAPYSPEDTRTKAILLGKILVRRGAILGCRMGRVAEGRGLAEESLSLFRRLDARKEAAFALNILGVFERQSCRYERARKYAQESLNLFREAGDRWGCAYSCSDLGNVAYLLGEYAEARQLHEESLLISRQTGDRRAVVFCLNDVTGVAIALGDYEGGLRLCQEALATSREIGHPWAEATAIYQTGEIASHMGDYSRARGLLQESIEVFEELGDQQRATLPMRHLAHLSYLCQDYEQARQMLQRVLSICSEAGDLRGRSAALNLMGRVAEAVGEMERARSCLGEALSLAARIGAVPLILDVLVSLAIALPEQDDALRWTMLSLARDHPATEHQTREEARRILAGHREAGAAGIPGSSEPVVALRQVLERIALSLPVQPA